MGDIKLGNSAIGSIKFSTQDVDKAYLGENLVYSSYKPEYDGNAVLVYSMDKLRTFVGAEETHSITPQSGHFTSPCINKEEIITAQYFDNAMHIQIYDFALHLKDEIILPELGSCKNAMWNYMIGGNGRILLNYVNSSPDGINRRVTFINLKDKIPHYFNGSQPNSGCVNKRYYYVENSDEFICLVQDTTDTPLHIYRLNENTCEWERTNKVLDNSVTNGCGNRYKYSYLRAISPGSADTEYKGIIVRLQNAIGGSKVEFIENGNSSTITPIDATSWLVGMGRTYNDNIFIGMTVNSRGSSITGWYRYNIIDGSIKSIMTTGMSASRTFGGVVQINDSEVYVLSGGSSLQLDYIYRGVLTNIVLRVGIIPDSADCLFIIKNQIN